MNSTPAYPRIIRSAATIVFMGLGVCERDSALSHLRILWQRRDMEISAKLDQSVCAARLKNSYSENAIVMQC